MEILGNNLPGIKCDPKLFIKFGRKATIFTSSIVKGIALTLPVRKIHIFRHTQYRVCGSIFTSIYIESLLASPNSLEMFKNSIVEIFQKYKREFQSYIINQNKQSNENNKNFNIISESQITQFFDINPDDENHFFTINNSWPDLKSILTSRDKWNIDISLVNSREYEDISLSELLIKIPSIKKIPNPNFYGPNRRENDLLKFFKDFEKAVSIELSEHKIQREFRIEYNENDEDKQIYNIGIGFLGYFYHRINRYVIPNLSIAIMKLEKPISKFFNEKTEYNSFYVGDLFGDAFKSIFPFWKNY